MKHMMDRFVGEPRGSTFRIRSFAQKQHLQPEARLALRMSLPEFSRARQFVSTSLILVPEEYPENTNNGRPNEANQASPKKREGKKYHTSFFFVEFYSIAFHFAASTNH